MKHVQVALYQNTGERIPFSSVEKDKVYNFLLLGNTNDDESYRFLIVPKADLLLITSTEKQMLLENHQYLRNYGQFCYGHPHAHSLNFTLQMDLPDEAEKGVGTIKLSYWLLLQLESKLIASIETASRYTECMTR